LVFVQTEGKTEAVMPWYIKAPHRSRTETAVFVAAIVVALAGLTIFVLILISKI
jgi:hypothetical protein